MSDEAPTLEERLASIRALTPQDAPAAAQQLRTVFRVHDLDEVEALVSALEALELVSRELGIEPLLGPLERVVRPGPGGVEAEDWFELGQACTEIGLPEAAVPVLARGAERFPDEPGLHLELAVALGRTERHALAVAHLSAAPHHVRTSPPGLYLIASHALYAGDVERAAVAAGQIPREVIPPDVLVPLETSLARAASIRPVCPLDPDDLRGWHYVIQGGLLLHLSPYGVEVMRGRYAFLQDDYATQRVGLERVIAVLDVWGVAVPRVLHTGDRGSRVLAHAAAERLGKPLAPLDDGPGLVVTYDTENLAPEVLEGLEARRPGQIWWQHTLCWTEGGTPCPDLVTLLVQANTPPWGAVMRVDPDTQEVVRADPATEPPEILARQILDVSLPDEGAAAVEAGELHPRDRQEDLLRVAALVGGMRRVAADLPRAWFTPGAGPVPSARFH